VWEFVWGAGRQTDLGLDIRVFKALTIQRTQQCCKRAAKDFPE